MFLIPISIIILYGIYSYSYLNADNSSKRLNARNKEMQVILFILCMFTSFRSIYVGNDTLNFYNLYKDIGNTSWADVIVYFYPRFELGYLYLNKCLYTISETPQLLFITSGVLIYYVVFKLVKFHSPYVGLSIVLFFFLRYHDSMMNEQRQSLALSFTLLAYMGLVKGRTKRFFLLLLLAFFFHRSSIVFIFAYPLSRIKFKLEYLKFCTLVAGISFIASSVIIAKVFSLGIIPEYYENSDYFEGGKIAPLIILLIRLIFFFFFLRNMGYVDVERNGIIQRGGIVAWMLIMGILFDILNLNFALMGRVGVYYSFFNIIAIPYALANMTVKYRRFCMSIFLFFLILYYYSIIIIRPNWNTVYPYIPFWEV